MVDQSSHPVLKGDRLLEIPPVETHLIRSRHVQQTFRIQVMQPGRRPGDSLRYPVVYVTDANWVFDMVKSLSYLLQLSSDDAPPFMVVGIGYPGDSPHAGFLLRVRDFTAPPYQPRYEIKSLGRFVRDSIPSMGLYEGTLVPEEGSKEFYGGEDFRRFIGEELIPFVDDRYPTEPKDRTYFGHSGGGFFGLYSLFTSPELFKNYIVSSPGLIYHGTGPGGVVYENDEFGLQMAKAFIDSGKPLSGARLYLSAGAEEEYEPAVANWRLTSSLMRFARLLKSAAIPGLELVTEIFPGETHITAWPIAFTHGIQAMLGTRRVARTIYF